MRFRPRIADMLCSNWATPAPFLAHTRTPLRPKPLLLIRPGFRSLMSILFLTANRGISVAPMSSRTRSTSASCSRTSGLESSDTCNNKLAVDTSSRVDIKASTRACGRPAINPTVSERITDPKSGISSRLIVGSSVANSWSAVYACSPTRVLKRDDFPALVYPTIATVGMPSLYRRCRRRSRCEVTRASRLCR